MSAITTNIREYAEELPVELVYEKNRIALKAYNEAGLNCTIVDLFDIFEWVKSNMPELIKNINK